MHKQAVFMIIGAILLLLPGAFLGLIIGAFIGGNFFTDFVFQGVRGYEATGRIGAYVGAAVGLLAGVKLGGAWFRHRQLKGR